MFGKYNTVQIHGSVIVNSEERITEAAEKNQIEVMKVAYCVAVEKFRTLPRCAPTTYEEWRSRSGRGVAGVWKWCAVVNDFE